MMENQRGNAKSNVVDELTAVCWVVAVLMLGMTVGGVGGYGGRWHILAGWGTVAAALATVGLWTAAVRGRRRQLDELLDERAGAWIAEMAQGLDNYRQAQLAEAERRRVRELQDQRARHCAEIEAMRVIHKAAVAEAEAQIRADMQRAAEKVVQQQRRELEAAFEVTLKKTVATAEEKAEARGFARGLARAREDGEQEDVRTLRPVPTN